MTFSAKEKEVLVAIATGRLPTWGAAVGQAIEVLKGNGFIKEGYVLTPKGAAFLVLDEPELSKPAWDRSRSRYPSGSYDSDLEPDRGAD